MQAGGLVAISRLGANSPSALVALAALVETMPDGLHRRHNCRADGVHHVVCMPFQESAEYKHPIQRVTLGFRLRGAQQSDDAARRRTVTGVGFLPRAQLCSKAPDNVAGFVPVAAELA